MKNKSTDYVDSLCDLCATSVLFVPLWLEGKAKDFTTEAQKAQRSHREPR